VLVDHLATKVELDLLRPSEVQVEAGIVARNRVEVVRLILAFLTTLVKSRLCDVELALLIKLGGTLEIAEAFWAHTDVFCDLLLHAFELTFV